MFLRRMFVLSLLALAPIPAQAADIVTKAQPMAVGPGPAVDGFNFKFDGFGGSLANRTVYGATGSFSLPLGYSYGLQIDGAVGSFDSDVFAAGQAHLFWRDPSRALFGFFASHTHWDRFSGLNATQLGGEGYLYFGQWTLGGTAGVEFGNATSGTVGALIESYDVKTRFFDKIDLSYYINDNFKLSVGHRFVGGRNAAAAGIELGIPLGGGTMVALFGEGRLGEDDYHGLWGGLRVYWGQKGKGLMDRHRRDDPPGISADTVATFTNSSTTTPITGNGGGGAPKLTPQQQCERDGGNWFPGEGVVPPQCFFGPPA
jgi:hypothetical protein